MQDTFAYVRARPSARDDKGILYIKVVKVPP